MLAPLHALLVVDTKDFTRNPDAQQPGLYSKMRDAASSAFEQAGLLDTWRNVSVDQTRGDGFLAIFPHDAMPALIFPFLDSLQAALAEAAPSLRVGLHAGLIDDQDPLTAAIGSAPNDVCRLLDSDPVCAALRNSDPGVTFVAAVISAAAFDMYVRGGHASLPPSRFTPVRARFKHFDQPAYLYVPVQSAKASQPDSPPDDGVPSPAPPRDAPGASQQGVSITGHGNQAAFGNQVGGSIVQKRS
jgi:hypothetical protein